MPSNQEQSPQKEPEVTPGEPLRPDPGYPETLGGTRAEQPPDSPPAE